MTPEAPATRAPRWKNPYARLPAVRWAVQGAYALFLLVVGFEFYRFYVQALGGGPVTANRPPSVEAFLPISALLGLKRLLLTGRWDAIHPAGLAIFLGALVGAFAARKAFCSWVCPVGTLSRALEWVGRKTLWRRPRREPVVPAWLDVILTVPKYLLLAFFLWAIVWKMDLASIEAFLSAPYNYAADAKMLLFFVELSGTGLAVLLVLAGLSIVVKNFWCRYLCPYGALLGLASLVSPLRVRRDAATCTDCAKCTRVCPAQIKVHTKRAVWSPECTGCTACLAACPVKDCLTVTRKAEKGWPAYVIPAVGVGVMLAAWALAALTGHWQTAVSTETLREVYRQAAFLGHP